MKTLAAGLVVIAAAGTFAVAQGQKPMSPAGTAAAQVQGTWVQGQRQSFTLGRGSYQNGKWIELSFGRPLKRGRDLWGAGPTYGKDALVEAPIWRAGANVSTQLTNEVPIAIAGQTLAPGTYTLFIDLKENNWTFVVSTLKAQPVYDANNKVDVWGGYNYTPAKDVLRTKMKLETLPHSFEQLSWQFLDMTPTGGTLAVMWDRVMASVPFTVAG
ncbi:MAG TPA: DUF2911 domain-containing protein [Vicinamibacterales bacterium]|nr:DUF2911 domain-containing protein [Vicinamibacterales bacterium]